MFEFLRASGTLKQVRKILGWTTGGIHKRVDENRELLEVLYRDAPEFLETHPWVRGWLQDNDQFLRELRRAVPIAEGRFVGRVREGEFPRPWPNGTDTSKLTEAVVGYVRITGVDPKGHLFPAEVQQLHFDQVYAHFLEFPEAWSSIAEWVNGGHEQFEAELAARPPGLAGFVFGTALGDINHGPIEQRSSPPSKE